MRATRYDRYRRAQNADHFAHNSPFSAFFAEVVCTLGMTPPRTAISPPPKGVCTTSMESTARPAGPGCGTRGLRCPWAAARPGRASRRRTQPRTATQAPPVWRVPEGTEGTGALRDDAPSHAQRHKRRRYGGCRQDQRVAVPGCGARGRRRGLAGLVTATQALPMWRVPEGTEGTGALRADAPIRTCHRAPLGREAGYPGGGTHTVGPGRASRRRAQPRTTTQAPPVWRVPEGPEGTGGLRDRPLRAVGSRVAISRAAGPDGTRNTSGTTSKTISQVARRPRAHQAARPQHAHTRTCTRPHTIQA